MQIRNVQLTIVLPYKYDESRVLDVLNECGDNIWVRKCKLEGRTLTSWAVTRKEENETELVLNFE
jgi:hypothetical protein